MITNTVAADTFLDHELSDLTCLLDETIDFRLRYLVDVDQFNKAAHGVMDIAAPDVNHPSSESDTPVLGRLTLDPAVEIPLPSKYTVKFLSQSDAV